jgi:hypothetical protein
MGDKEEFRKCAEECNRLAIRLKSHEHKLLAAEIAATWLALALVAEKREPRS